MLWLRWRAAVSAGCSAGAQLLEAMVRAIVDVELGAALGGLDVARATCRSRKAMVRSSRRTCCFLKKDRSYNRTCAHVKREQVGHMDAALTPRGAVSAAEGRGRATCFCVI